MMNEIIKKFANALFAMLVKKIEKAIDIDLDGDGKIGE